jgi:F-type H+-transporting ATPase subunit epsilon
MKTLTLKIVTPERIVFEGEVAQATLPARDGEITVLPDHVPYIGAVRPGEIMVKRDGAREEVALATSGGFVEFHGNVLTVLADTAERAEEIDLSRAEAARRRAEAIMGERVRFGDEEYARTAALLEKELARIRVAHKHRTRHGLHIE